MTLHHFVTVFLYGFSYYCNFTTIGSVIMYLHDFADVFTSGVQCFTETKYKNVSVFFAMGMTISWFYTRCLVLPYVMYKGAQQKYFFRDYEINSNACHYLGVFLLVLVTLHYYWFYVLTLALKKFATKGVVADN